MVVTDPSGRVDTEGGIVVKERNVGDDEITSVVLPRVVSDPFGNVDIEGGIAISDWEPGACEVGVRISVLPFTVVKELPGRIDVEGGRFVSDGDSDDVGRIVFVLSGMIVIEPLGRVDVD